MVVFTDEKFVLGTILSSLFGFLILYTLYGTNCDNKRKKRIETGCNDYAAAAERKTECCSPENASGSDVIIVGAGVAGAALAYALGKVLRLSLKKIKSFVIISPKTYCFLILNGQLFANLQDGRQVHVIERDMREPDRIVGELLQPGGYFKLIELGLGDCLEEIDAQQVLGYALFKDGKSTRLSYPLEKFHSDVAGRSFHNGRFIQRMRGKVARLPNVLLEQGTVTCLLEENGTVKGVQYKIKDGKEIRAYAPLTIVCDGCFSKMRQNLCNSKVDVPSCCVGLLLDNCQLPFPNHGHVILADPSPILIYPISSTQVRCLVDIPGQKLPPIANGKMAKYLKNMVASQIPFELHDSFISAIDKGNIKTMPNRGMRADPRYTPGAFLLGDAFNMRHPLTGGGMTVTLSDIVILRDLLKPLHDLNNTAAVTECLKSFYTLRKPVASTINILAGALYMVFSVHHDQARKEMRQACFDYLSLRGEFSSGPMGLLSGLSPCPLNLVFHFFGVAIYAAGRLLLPLPSLQGICTGGRIISNALRIIFPIIRAEGVSQTFFPLMVLALQRITVNEYLKW
ncbi:hypothetical protein K2173_002577 [Erythroxylum novogranatense]|uniref:Squalene monooxygenase n=1 Tax=Erythroxylum novogranatense TaxID=1862640 RepID=A0AAV8TT55_9ROSI|nr:hypothetical protein K2173_002577 [Erythroxylum novogranatense]